MRLIDDARHEFHRLWTIRVGLFFGAFNGAMIGFAAFDNVLNLVVLLAINVVGWAILIGARLLKQPGADKK